MSVGTTPVQYVTKGFFPLDEQLGLKDQRWSEGLAKQAVWLSGMVPYEQAAEILQGIGQVAISGSSVWRLAQKWGERLVELEAKEQAQANAMPDGKEIIAGEEQHKRRMGLSMDGTMIYIRGEEWKELKVGCVFDVVMRPVLDKKTGEWMEQGHAAHNSYTCHLGGPEVFGQKVWTEAQRRRFRQALESEVVADGAVWIWNLVADHFDDSQQLVDWYHGTEHLAHAAHLLHGEGSPAAKRWLKVQETVLYQGGADEIADSLRTWAEHKPAIREELRAEAGYFEKNQNRMNYMEMREEGWVIGSGMVESGGKQYKARFCGAGMRWSRAGAERLLPVRTAILSKRFDKRWQAVYNLPKN
jgi:hypothetical protein